MRAENSLPSSGFFLFCRWADWVQYIFNLTTLQIISLYLHHSGYLLMQFTNTLSWMHISNFMSYPCPFRQIRISSNCCLMFLDLWVESTLDDLKESLCTFRLIPVGTASLPHIHLFRAHRQFQATYHTPCHTPPIPHSRTP